MVAVDNSTLVKTTTHKVVLPFYIYAGVSFLAATILALIYSSAFTQHYFHPKTLAITHTMALGWGTMIILGASHQLVPVLIEGKLFSNVLAHLSFVLAALGIPVLIYGFFKFNMGWPCQLGGIFINASILAYLVNVAISILQSKTHNVQAVFIFTAALWLLLTSLAGLLLVFNFSTPFLSNDSLHYLPLHAHMGIGGWFLLIITGVGSRLIPLFLISKYDNPKLLWLIYLFINGGLLVFVFGFLYYPMDIFFYLSVALILTAIILFGYFCRRCFKERLRKRLDDQVKISLLSAVLMIVPLIVLVIIFAFLMITEFKTRLVVIYGFSIFFGWITTIILGMTFKTLPFIVWNKIYHHRAGVGKTPSPNDLFNGKIFRIMSLAYLSGFLLFIAGALLSSIFLLNSATVLLLLVAILYNWNLIKVLLHQPQKL